MPEPVMAVEQKPEPVKYEPPKPREPNPIAVFFSENTLAKVGGLLIFLAVVAFLSVAYAKIGPVGRFVMIFVVAAVIYAAGTWLYKKKLKVESHIVLGVSILVVYLDVLYARTIPAFTQMFGDGGFGYVVMFFLVLAVVFGVGT